MGDKSNIDSQLINIKEKYKLIGTSKDCHSIQSNLYGDRFVICQLKREIINEK